MASEEHEIWKPIKNMKDGMKSVIWAEFVAWIDL